MNRNNLVLIAVALLSMIGGMLLFHVFDSRTTAPLSPAAESSSLELHSIPLTGLDRAESLLGDWHQNILVVNFWAPWCAPCRREIPALIAINREYRARGVQVLGLAFDGEPQVKRFAEEYGIDYPLFLTTNRSPMYNAALGNPSGSLPFTVLLDRKLEIAYKHNGELTADQLRTELDKLL